MLRNLKINTDLQGCHSELIVSKSHSLCSTSYPFHKGNPLRAALQFYVKDPLLDFVPRKNTFIVSLGQEALCTLCTQYIPAVLCAVPCSCWMLAVFCSGTDMSVRVFAEPGAGTTAACGPGRQHRRGTRWPGCCNHSIISVWNYWNKGGRKL